MSHSIHILRLLFSTFCLNKSNTGKKATKSSSSLTTCVTSGPLWLSFRSACSTTSFYYQIDLSPSHWGLGWWHPGVTLAHPTSFLPRVPLGILPATSSPLHPNKWHSSASLGQPLTGFPFAVFGLILLTAPLLMRQEA